VAQSVRRYYDSPTSIHLVNAGKYGAGIVAYFFYILWCHLGRPGGWPLALYCISTLSHSIYAGVWDVYMDWGLFRPKSKYPFLRNDLGFRNHIPLYYFAIITNTLIRFGWIFYLSHSQTRPVLKTFIIGVLEMLRRWQWNFYRLESEHLGNMDQYRVTRDVPLPYSFNNHRVDDDDEEDPFRPSGVIWIGPDSALNSRRSSAQSSTPGSSFYRGQSPPPDYQQR